MRGDIFFGAWDVEGGGFVKAVCGWLSVVRSRASSVKM